MSEKIWVTSDTHFNHANIIRYCARPYADTEEMNKDLIKRWNAIVRPQDIVYHLGDFGMGNKEAISKWRRALNGKIKLIKGNHDDHSNQWYRDCGFDEVYDRPILVQGFYILSHAPLEFMTDNIPFANIYGHVHNDARWKPFTTHSFNACVEVNDYHPILFEDIKEIMKGVSENETVPNGLYTGTSKLGEGTD